jgi:hypothetical protein
MYYKCKKGGFPLRVQPKNVIRGWNWVSVVSARELRGISPS